MSSASRKRREGREAFCHGCDPNNFNPYKLGWDRECWLDGWNEGQQDHDDFELEKEKENSEWEDLSSCCPWKDNILCSPLNSTLSELCSKENCAIYYFRNKG